MGIWDWLFGETTELELPNGVKRKVTRKWFDEMLRQGRIRRVSVDGETIRVHSIGKTPSFSDPHEFDEWLLNGANTYTVETWKIGQDISQEIVDQWRDAKTGDLYIVNQVVDGKWKLAPCKRELWERLRAVRDRPAT